MIKIYDNKLSTILVPLLLFVLTPFLVALHVYFSNSSEFSFRAWEMALFLLPLLGLFLAFLLILLVIIPRAAQTYIVCILGAAGVLFWIQGYILNWDYGVMTGTPITWSDYHFRLFIDISIWIFVMAIFFVFAKKARPHLVYVSLVLLSVQGVSLVFAWTDSSEPPGFHRYTISNEEMMDFSREKNIVILMLDAFQTDVFQEIIDDEPEYKKLFKNFTFFRNTTAQYSKTYGAIPALLTGHWYENRQSIQDFLAKSFEDSISTRLIEDGWDSQLFPLSPRIIGYSEDYASNIHLRADRSAISGEAGKLLDIALFRSSPQFVKPFWLNNFEWRMKNVMSFLEDSDRDEDDYLNPDNDFQHPILEFVCKSIALLNSENPDPVFKFLHFNIPHAPFILNENLEIENLPHDRDGFKRYSIAGLEAVRVFIERLKAENIYDQTMLFVISDHGGGEYSPGVLDHDDIQKDEGSIPSAHHESGLPLLLVKPFNYTGEFKISDAPASLGDVLMTIATALELDYDYKGSDLFSLSEDEDRTRRYLFYEFQGWRRDYLPEMTEYEVSGHAWSPSSWRPTGRFFPPGLRDDGIVQQQVLDNGLQADEVYSFTSWPRSDFFSHGWLNPGKQGVWSGYTEAYLDLKFDMEMEFPAKISVYLTPYTCGGEQTSQYVKISQDQSVIAEFHVEGEGWYQFIVYEPKNENSTEILFFLPDAVSPFECNEGFDTNLLGVSLRQLIVEEFPALYNISEFIDFSSKGASSEYVVEGWSDQEQYHRWTNQEQARMLINITDADEKDLLLRITAGASLKGDKSFQEVDLMVNGNHSASWKIDENRWYEAVIPSRFYENGKLDLTFNVHDPVAPCEVSESADCRKLGMLVTEMQILAYPDKP